MLDNRLEELQNLKLYDLSEVSEIVGLTPQTLKRHIKAGKLTAKIIGGKYRVTKDSLEKYVNGAQ